MPFPFSFFKKLSSKIANAIAFWYLNGNTNDSSGNGNTGTLVGSPSFTPGLNGNQALLLNGLNQYMNGGILPYSVAITISAWVNCTTFGPGGGYSAIVFKTLSDGSEGISFTILPSGKLFLLISDSNGGAPNYNGTGTYTLSTNTWYFVAMTYDSVNGLVGYVNGNVDNTVPTDGTIANFSAVTTVGTNLRAVSATLFQGLIQDVRIYSVALNSTQITNLYNAGAA